MDNPNPFVERGMIRDPAKFFGRKPELAEVFARLTQMQSVSVVGERRIGKSSLLYHIFQTGQQRLGGDVRVIYVDLQRVTDEKEFYTRILEEVGKTGKTFRNLERAVVGKRVIACLDEFEKVAGNDAFSLEFFDTLRSLAQSGHLALVVATEHSLAQLCRNDDIRSSPFWNIFSRLDLGLMEEAEAQEMMTTLFERAGVKVSEVEVLRMMRLAGCFHLFLQIAGFHFCEAKQGRKRDWRKAFEREAKDHLVYLWGQRTKEEQAALKWIVKGEGKPPQEETLEELERRGLVMQQEETWCVFSDAFEALVRKPPRRPRKLPGLEEILNPINKLADTASKVKGLLGRGKSDKG